MRECDMRYDAVAEECRYSSSSAIEELIWYHYVRGCISFLHRPDSRSRNDSFDAESLEGVDICAKWQLGWHQPVSAAMSRKKSHSSIFKSANDKLVRWCAKRRCNVDFRYILEAGHLVEAAPAYYAYFDWFNIWIDAAQFFAPGVIILPEPVSSGTESLRRPPTLTVKSGGA